MRALLIALAFVALATPLAHADSFEYVVSGTASVPDYFGNVCDGGPCVQTLTFSFPFELIPNPEIPGLYMGSWAPSDNVQSFGPLSPFTLHGRIGGVREGPTFLPFINAEGDEIDIKAAMWTTTPSIAPRFDLAAVELYACQSEACIESLYVRNGITIALGVPGFGTVTATRVSEPLTLLLVGIGLSALAGVRRARWL